MKKKILSLALALVMALTLAPSAVLAAVSTKLSFEVKFEYDIYGGVLQFSEKPIETLTGDDYYNTIAYVFPTNTKVAYLKNGSYIEIYTILMKSAPGYEITLTNAGREPKGFRICTYEGGVGLLEVYIEREHPAPPVNGKLSFEVKFEHDYFGEGIVQFSENPTATLKGDEYIGGIAYVFPPNTKAAYLKGGSYIEIFLRGEKDGAEYAVVGYEITLTNQISKDPFGFYIVSTEDYGYLTTAFIDSDPLKPLVTDSLSFEVKFEQVHSGAGILQFSENPIETLTGDDYYNRIAYVFPLNTKVAYLEGGAYVEINAIGESSLGGILTHYGTGYEISLTKVMKADPLGIRLCHSEWGYSLLSVFVAGDPLLSLTDKDFTIEHGALVKYTGSGGAVTIPDGVVLIKSGAFEDCAAITGVTIPSSVTLIGENAFSLDFTPDLIIYGEAGSYAETYAKANDIPFSTGTPLDTASDWARPDELKE